MQPRLLLDTHIVIRWLADPKRLSTKQRSALTTAANRQELMAVSAVTLLEIALLEGQSGFKSKPKQVLTTLEVAPEFAIVPVSFEIAAEIVSLGANLRDPADRTIVATARVHRLRLVTSEQRIINSKLVETIE